ncbi:MAG: PIG-L family deacetylase [Acidimicrobiaceae bacterium]|nr:PIG-L family deacetylase [Acidimicrobiaceae bacterium]MDE0514817.1 PIG-L family deacetylase [Acidimicrobiaceae bacterium]MDE0657824.1 PIG-L family deacetylase [Acidimicrobiaceae bacterium]MXZ96474.1 PIG-L family deacetylase [Acidimicrobiaceae bacterium]MYF41831.1 PIG-L family deacetylase [Acidimicrobiaceae bacterium]
MTTVDVAVPARALAIGAHPDDIEFGCGATLAKWAGAGCEASLLVCTDGSKGTWDAGADIAALVARRQREQSEAGRRLGALGEVRFLGEVDGELEVTMALRSRMAKVIRELRPDVVLGHDPFKRWRLHPDHRAAGFLCMDALVAARDPHFFPEHGVPHHRPVELLLFECEAPDHVEQVAPANIEAKVQALLAHESQFVSTHGIRSDDDGTGMAAFRARVVEKCRDAGRRAGLPYGEAFKRVERV